MTDDITFVGLDVSKETISVGIAPGDPREAVHYFGTIVYRPTALYSLCKKLSRDGARLHFCYEAGPFGYSLQIEQPDVWKFGTPLISHPLLSK